MSRLLFFTYAALSLFFILPPPVCPSDWRQVESSIPGETNYIDLDSIRYNKAVATFLARNIDNKGEMMLTSYSINCEKGTGAIRDIIIYGPEETVVKSYSFTEEKLQWGRITAHSFMYGFHQLLCRKKAPN